MKLYKTTTLLIAILLLSGCSKTQQTAEEKAIAVAVDSATIKSIEKTISYPGQVKASEQIPVSGKLSGKVDEVFFQQGDIVKAGDILYTMDKVDLENNIKTLEAQLVTANAAVRSAQTGVSSANGSQTQSQELQSQGTVNQAESALKQAQTSVEQSQLAIVQKELGLQQAQNTYDTAFQTYNDTKILFDGGVVSKNQMDQVETALKNADTALQAAKSGLEQTQNSLYTSQVSLEQAQKAYQQALDSKAIVTNLSNPEVMQRAQDVLTQAQAQKNSAEVSLQLAKEKLQDAAVRSPIDGVVSSRNIEPKMMISPSTVPFTIVQAEAVEIKVNITESILNSLSVGQKVTVDISAASDSSYLGEIIRISPAANDINNTFEVRIAMSNDNNAIKPGMYAEVFFVKEKDEQAFVVPRSAVLRDGLNHYIYIVEADIAKKTPIEIGIDNGNEIQILTQINENTQIVVKGQKYLKDGAKVVIQPAVSS